jgi:hypothetical protein
MTQKLNNIRVGEETCQFNDGTKLVLHIGPSCSSECTDNLSGKDSIFLPIKNLLLAVITFLDANLMNATKCSVSEEFQILQVWVFPGDLFIIKGNARLCGHGVDY